MVAFFLPKLNVLLLKRQNLDFLWLYIVILYKNLTFI